MKYMKWLSAAVISATLLSGCNDTEYLHVGPNWDALWNLEQQAGSVKVTARAGSSYALGEHMDFKVRSNRDGYLWVVQVDPNDEVSQLFPNDAMTDNAINANQELMLPPVTANWAIERVSRWVRVWWPLSLHRVIQICRVYLTATALT